MDTLSVSGIQLLPEKDFDHIVEIRAQRHEHLRGRNNVTSCRSPTREIDTRWIKNELKRKRHQEFLRRRLMSPELRALGSTNRTNASERTFSLMHLSSVRISETPHTNVQNTPTGNGHPAMILTPNSKTDGSSNSGWASLWSEQVTPTGQEKSHTSTPASTSAQNKIHAQKTGTKTFIQTKKIHQNVSIQTENTVRQKIVREASVQTDSGLVNVKETEVQQLSDYLQEALWREEAVKKKLAALQESTANLMNSSRSMWTARCSEELLRNEIKALEAQLQICLQKLPKEGMKKLVLQMEKQKLVYEEKVLVVLQKATQEKTEAISNAAMLQEALMTAKAEALRWQNLYEELKLSSGQLRESQLFCNEQLQQLHSQVELSRARDAELREEVASLRQEKKELQYNFCLLEEDNQALRDEIQDLRDESNESKDFVTRLPSEEPEPQVVVKRDTRLEEELRLTQEKLQLKERECDELQTELCTMEQECQSSQARLSQCRQELRQLSQRNRRPTLCGPWWKVWMFFLLLLAVVEVAMLWLWLPPFRELVAELYSDIEARIEDYLLETDSPEHSSCFRPI